MEACVTCKSRENLRQCSQCNIAVYCSETCQARDWNALHSLLCDKLQYIEARKRKARDQGNRGDEKRERLSIISKRYYENVDYIQNDQVQQFFYALTYQDLYTLNENYTEELLAFLQANNQRVHQWLKEKGKLRANYRENVNYFQKYIVEKVFEGEEEFEDVEINSQSLFWVTYNRYKDSPVIVHLIQILPIDTIKSILKTVVFTTLSFLVIGLYGDYAYT